MFAIAKVMNTVDGMNSERSWEGGINSAEPNTVNLGIDLAGSGVVATARE